MFTGIIECTGKILSGEEKQNLLTLTIQSPVSSELKPDQSVAHNGICLTVTSVHEHTHTVDIIPETLRCSDPAKWQPGRWVNLERSIRSDGRWDGHFVYGHVDISSPILTIKEISSSMKELHLFCPEEFRKYLIYKGSICVDGVSLTISEITKEGFKVNLIPYTLKYTTLSLLKENDKVHLEFDVLAKYVERIFANRK